MRNAPSPAQLEAEIEHGGTVEEGVPRMDPAPAMPIAANSDQTDQWHGAHWIWLPENENAEFIVAPWFTMKRKTAERGEESGGALYRSDEYADMAYFLELFGGGKYWFTGRNDTGSVVRGSIVYRAFDELDYPPRSLMSGGRVGRTRQRMRQQIEEALPTRAPAPPAPAAAAGHDAMTLVVQLLLSQQAKADAMNMKLLEVILAKVGAPALPATGAADPLTQIQTAKELLVEMMTMGATMQKELSAVAGGGGGGGGGEESIGATLKGLAEVLQALKATDL